MQTKTLLVIVCAIAFLARLLLAAQAPTLAPEAYQTVRAVEHIQETGAPLITDSLSWGGRTVIGLPLFPYVVAFGGLFMPNDLTFIIMPNLLAVLLHAALFYLILELTNSETLALTGAIASIFIPTYLEATLLTASSLSLAVPLLVILITLFLKLRKSKEKRLTLLWVFLLLCATHPFALILIPFFIMTIALAVINRSRGETAQREFALFAVGFLLWLYLLLYKRSLQATGFSILHGNIPPALESALYGQFTLLALAVAIGIVPFGLALYASYKEATAKHIGIQATLALAISTAIAMVFKLIPLETGTVLFSVVCVALAMVGLQHILQYSKALKRRTLPRAVLASIAILFLFTSILPTVTAGITAIDEAVPLASLNAAQWLSENSQKQSVLLVKPSEGFLYEAVAKRPVYIDQNYLGRADAEERYTTATSIPLSAKPSVLARTEHIDYIITDTLIEDECLNTVYRKDNVWIAKVLCS